MFASLITIVAALLLACASPHAEANVRASERVSMSFADLAQAAEPETVGSGSPKALETSYLPNGQIDGHVLPSGAVVRYTYRADGRMLTVRVNGVEIVRQIDFHAFGELKSWGYGSADQYQRVFDQDGRIKQHSAGSQSRAIRFDPASRIRAIDDGAGGANRWTFGYDNLDRLDSADNLDSSGPIANLNLAWDYDPTGNRTSETRGVNPPSPYQIDPASNRLSSISGQTRQYDAVGNTLNDGLGTTSVYSARNRLVRTTKAGLSTTYAHSGFGERVCKALDGTGACPTAVDRIEYVYDDSGHLIGEYPVGGSTAQAVEYVWLDDTPIAVLNRRVGSSDGGPSGGGAATAWNGTAAGGVDMYYLHPDQLDTPRVVVNAQSQEIWRWDSAPFGDTLADEQPSGLAGYAFNLRFPGQQFDRETGTHHNQFRDYEAGTGRYVQSDPIGLEGGLNPFLYSDSGPLSWFDPEGLKTRGPKRGLKGPHNQTIRKVANCLKNAKGPGKSRILAGGKQGVDGNKYKEETIKIPGTGRKRRPDITFSSPACGGDCFFNVGKNSSLPGGPRAPVPRELRAMNDLRGAGRKGIFVPYNDPAELNKILKNCNSLAGLCK